jgi:acetylornithine deacetylase/succinyl-diaminopimelate desuccinylase-like protein
MHALLLSALLAAAAPLPEGPADRKPVYQQVQKQHAKNVERLRQWIALPSIAAEDLNSEQGVQRMIQLLKDAGFQKAVRVPTDGKPGVFATLDAGAPKTLGVYFMYDVKQFDPKEWSSPPLAAKLVDKPELGKVMMGRGAVNQKGPQSAFLAALHAFKAAGKKLPVNLVLVAEGEEEIGSPHIGQVVYAPEVQAALKKTLGVFMPFPSQNVEGNVTVMLGAKGVVELELISSAEKWGRGSTKDVHSSLRAQLDSPAFHLVQALNTLVTPEGDPAIEGFADKARAPTPEEVRMVEEGVRRNKEEDAKRTLGVTRWAHDASWRDAQLALISKPTVNIEGLVAGYTGPGGKTVLPTRAVAKLDMRLVPGMTYQGAIDALKAHLQKRGFGDIEVKPSGGYDPTQTDPNSAFVQKAVATYKTLGYEAPLWPRLAGSYPGYIFTNPPLSLPAGHFGLGYGSGAHAPDEFFVIESTHPRIQGYDGAVRSYVDYLYALAE